MRDHECWGWCQHQTPSANELVLLPAGLRSRQQPRTDWAGYDAKSVPLYELQKHFLQKWPVTDLDFPFSKDFVFAKSFVVVDPDIEFGSKSGSRECERLVPVRP